MQRISSWLRNASFWFAARINVYTIGLTALWTPLGAVILQERVTDTTSLDFRSTALGLITFVGIGVAAFTQPIAGRISDRGPWPDRRRPFIIGATVLDLMFLVLFWWAPDYGWLFGAYLLLQLSSNFGQAAFQALIPDLVEERIRGLASGVKNAFDLLGSAIGLGGAGLLLLLGYGLGVVLIYVGAVLAVTALLTFFLVPRVPPLPEDQRARSLWQLLSLGAVRSAFALDYHRHRDFALTVVVRFIFLLGLYPFERFFLFFLEDRFSLRGAVQTTTMFVLVALVIGGVGAAVAGILSDRVGRKTGLTVGIVIAVAGCFGMAFSPTLFLVAATGAVAIVGLGAFQAVNWAMLADFIPEGRGARFYGLANIATSGASAIAGLFGLLIGWVREISPGTEFEVAFALASFVALFSLIPLHFIRGKDSS